MTSKIKQPILIVEDSPEDYEATVRGFRKARLANPIYHCPDGDEALDYLFRRGEYVDPKDSPKPGIIMLDLNLPGTDGREVLEAIKADPELKSIPVVVLTTSNDPRDVEQCYRDGASSYVHKPVDLIQFMHAIQELTSYWFEIVILPHKE